MRERACASPAARDSPARAVEVALVPPQLRNLRVSGFSDSYHIGAGLSPPSRAAIPRVGVARIRVCARARYVHIRKIFYDRSLSRKKKTV